MQICSLTISVLAVASLATSVQAATPMVAVGGIHVLALDADGTVYAWGGNAASQLGVPGSTIMLRSLPAVVDGLPKTIKQVAAGPFSSYAVTEDGAVYAWGANNFCQLANGDSSNVAIATPQKVASLPAGRKAVQLAVGGGSVYVRLDDGSVVGWGTNQNGELGLGKIDASLCYPTAQVIPGLSNVVDIQAGGEVLDLAKFQFYGNAYARQQDGSVSTWGDNRYGQLGSGTAAGGYQATPQKQSLLSGVAAIAGGMGHTLALKTDGTVLAWGRNNAGQLGLGNTTDTATPSAVSGFGSNGVIKIAAGALSSLAITNNGGYYRWGTGVKAPGLTLAIDDKGKLLYNKRPNSIASSQNNSLNAVISNAGQVMMQEIASATTVNTAGELGNGTTTGLGVLTGSTLDRAFYGSRVLAADGKSDFKLAVSVATAAIKSNAALTGGKLTLSADVTVDSEDVGLPGNFYLAALVGNAILVHNGNAFVPYTTGDLPTYAKTTSLASRNIPVCTDLDVSGLSGVTIIVGYGKSSSDMATNKKYQTIYTIN